MFSVITTAMRPTVSPGWEGGGAGVGAVGDMRAAAASCSCTRREASSLVRTLRTLIGSNSGLKLTA